MPVKPTPQHYPSQAAKFITTKKLESFYLFLIPMATSQIGKLTVTIFPIKDFLSDLLQFESLELLVVN